MTSLVEPIDVSLVKDDFPNLKLVELPDFPGIVFVNYGEVVTSKEVTNTMITMKLHSPDLPEMLMQQAFERKPPLHELPDFNSAPVVLIANRVPGQYWSVNEEWLNIATCAEEFRIHLWLADSGDEYEGNYWFLAVPSTTS